MDIDLGSGIDGPETASIRLKDRDIPVVFLSGHTEPAVVEKTEKITSYGYVEKSSSITVLDASIKMAFKLFESKKNLQMKEAILLESEEKYRLLHEKTGLGIAYYSIDGLVYSYNQFAAKNMKGVPEDFNGKSIYDIFPKSNADFYLDRIKKAALSEDPVTYNDMITLPSGDNYFFNTFTRIVDKNKKLLGIQIITQETTEIELTKMKLHDSKKDHETILDASSQIMLSLNYQGIITLLNKNGHRLLGYTSPELIDKNWFDTCTPIELRDDLIQYFDKLKNGENDNLESYENVVITKSGERKTISWHNALLSDKNGKFISLFCSGDDITGRKQAEELIKQSENKWHTLFDILPVGVSILDADHKITDMNQRLGTILEISREGLQNGIYKQRKYLRFDGSLMKPDEFPSSMAIKEQRIIKNVEVGVVKENGETIWTNVTAAPLKSQGSACVLITQDITERKLAENEIKALLIEKELIMKEVHHRLKNNMNTVKGLLTLQIMSLEDPLAISALRDTISRVDSMVMLYNKLYCSPNFNDISILTYLPSLIDEIIANFPGSESVKVEKKIDDFILELKKLQPLGIIINELLTNIMKYAFTGRDNKMITVSATLTGKRVSIVISDNGNGIPESISFENSTGFGMQLVSLLTEQIGGSIVIERAGEKGSKVLLEFDLH